MPIAFVNDSATVSTTEYSLPGDTTTGVPTNQTDDCMLQVLIFVASIAAGDEFRVRVYERVNGQTAQVFDEFYLNNGKAVAWLPGLIVGDGWDITVTKTAGTDRVVHWSLRKIT
jgi:hypothetical protein